jgi:serine/threonine-protein kinase
MEALLESAADRTTQRRPEPPPTQSIAVLPFLDLSPAKNLEYFCDGIAEEIIDILARVSGVRVVARGSAFQFKDKDVRQIGAVLNVATVLEGSVREADNRLRIVAKLVDTTNGYQLWSERFDRSLDDVFAVQDEIAKAAASALGVRDSDKALRGGAYESYLKGRHYWNKRTESGLHESVRFFEDAVAKDPSYPEAHAGLAQAYATLGLYGALSPNEVMPKAKAEARKAIAVDVLGTLSGPFVTSGCIAGVYDWAWPEAERYFERAFEMNSNHPDAHHWYAINYLVPMKRFEEARRELERAVEADPLSTPIRVSCGLHLYFARQYEEALQELRQTVVRDPGSATARLFIGLALVELGRFDEAVRELQSAIRVSDSPEMTAALGYAHARAGNVDPARQALGKLLDLSGRRYVSSSLVAQVHAGLGDNASALERLENASAEHAADLAWLGVRPVFDSLRAEARFVNLVAALGQRG